MFQYYLGRKVKKKISFGKKIIHYLYGATCVNRLTGCALAVLLCGKIALACVLYRWQDGGIASGDFKSPDPLAKTTRYTCRCRITNPTLLYPRLFPEKTSRGCRIGRFEISRVFAMLGWGITIGFCFPRRRRTPFPLRQDCLSLFCHCHANCLLQWKNVKKNP